MKQGDFVKYIIIGKVGKCLGSFYHFQVWWMKVEWADSSIALVNKDYLEVFHEAG